MSNVPLPQLPDQKYPCGDCTACCNVVAVKSSANQNDVTANTKYQQDAGYTGTIHPVIPIVSVRIRDGAARR